MASNSNSLSSAMTSSTTDYSQPIRAPSPQPVMKKEKGDFKVIPKDRFSWGAAWMLSALALAVFVGDVLLMEHTKSGQLDGPLNKVAKRLLSWISNEMCILDCVLFGTFAIAFTSHALVRRGSGNKDGKKSYAFQSCGNKLRGSASRKHEGASVNQSIKQAGNHEGSAGSRCEAASVERSNGERSNAVVSRWNQAIDLAARHGDPDKAGQVLLEFERQGLTLGHKPDTVSFNLVIRAYARKGDVHGAEKWLARMEDSGIQATVCSYNTVLDACAKADDAHACETWLQRMLDKKVDPNVISYATAIYARARRGEEAKAEKWLRAMIDAGVQPDAVSYNSMIHACGVAGNAEGAERWIQEMQARGLETTVTTFTAVIDACAKAGDVPRAEKWLEAMITSQVQPNVVSFSAMIDACAKACDPTRAEYWHNRMVRCDVKPNAHSFSAVINACAKASDAARAEIWLGKSEEAGVANDVVVYSSVIDACGKAGDAERAMAVFRRMQANGIRPHIVAYAALARPYAYRGEWAEVESIAQEMDKSGIIMNEYFLYAQLLAYATTRPRQSQRAEICFRNALHAGIKPNDHVIGALARAVGRARCSELMRELCNGRAVPNPPQRREVRKGAQS